MTKQQKVISIEKKLAAATTVQELGIGLVSPPESPLMLHSQQEWKQVNGEVDSQSEFQSSPSRFPRFVVADALLYSAINSSFLFASDSTVSVKDDFSKRTLLSTLRQLNAQVTALQQYNAEARASNGAPTASGTEPTSADLLLYRRTTS